jgi:hypothetical protein
MKGFLVDLGCTSDALASHLSRWVAMTGDTVALTCTINALAKSLNRWVAMMGDLVDLACITETPGIQSKQVSSHDGGPGGSGLHYRAC